MGGCRINTFFRDIYSWNPLANTFMSAFQPSSVIMYLCKSSLKATSNSMTPQPFRGTTTLIIHYLYPSLQPCERNNTIPADLDQLFVIIALQFFLSPLVYLSFK